MKVKLGDACEILNGFAFKSENYVPSGIRIIRIANVQKGYIEDSFPCFYPLEQKNNLCRYMLYDGDLLLSLTGNVGRVALLHKDMLPAALNQRVACLRLKRNDILIKYLFHFMNSDNFEQDCVYSSKGIAQKNMSTEWLKEYVLDIPPIDAQQKKICVLDKIDILIEKRKQQLEKFDLLVKSKFIELFGDVVKNDKNWDKFVFSDITSSRLGKMLDSKKKTGKSTFPYLANYNVQWFKFELENLNSMDFDESDRIEFELKDEDLLVCEGGEIGRCAIWHNELQNCYFQKALHRVRCNRRIILPVYLAWWFKYNCDNNGFNAIKGAKATIAHLPGAKLKRLIVTTPPIELQNEFARFVEQTDKLKIKVKQSLEKLETLKKALMQNYFG